MNAKAKAAIGELDYSDMTQVALSCGGKVIA